VPNANIVFDGSGTSRTVTITPVANQNGIATITVQVSDGTATTSVTFVLTVTATSQHLFYIPLIQYPSTPDLVVSSISLDPNKSRFSAGEPVEISVVVENRGTAATGQFWVDLSINPNEPPTRANQLWNEHCTLSPCYGLAWYVEELAPGARVTLTSKTLPAGYSVWPGGFAAGTTDLYAYADSYNPGVAAGTVVESDETNNQFHLGNLAVMGSNPTHLSLQSATVLRARPVYLSK
jgi:hypothetical protein